MTRQQSRFIASDDIDAVVGWDFGPVDQSSVRFAAKVKAQEEDKGKVHDEQIRQAGFSDGFADGYAQGHAQATLEGQRQIADFIETEGHDAAHRYLQLFETAVTQLDESQQAMARGVLELACEVARQVLRHELSSNPNALQPIIREALSILAADCKAAVVRLNPLDLEILEKVLRAEFSSLALSLMADSNITRGGCLVESAGTVVDGTIENRWSRVVAKLGLDSSWEPKNDDE